MVSLLGGSRVQIGGPAGAFVPLLAPIVLAHGSEALVVCALMAVGTSLILASVLLVKRLAETAHVEADPEVTQGNSPGQQVGGKVIPDGVMVFRIFGAFFFGAADKLESSLRRTGELPDVLILRMRDALAVDATGIDALEELLEKLRVKKKDLILCGPHSQPLFALTRSGFLDRLGEENICGDMENSLARARQILNRK